MRSKPVKRMRVFAGPNGLGKSAVYDLIRRQYRTGQYINADEIEQVLSEKGFLHLEDFGLLISRSKFKKYLSQTPFASKSMESGLGINLRWSENVLVCSASKSNSYEAAFIAEMLRLELIGQGVTFSFETVMSHPAKLDIFQRTHDKGYRSYLYFVCTQDPSINIERVRNRVSKGGHHVPEIKIESRYFRSLKEKAVIQSVAWRRFQRTIKFIEVIHLIAAPGKFKVC